MAQQVTLLVLVIQSPVVLHGPQQQQRVERPQLGLEARAQPRLQQQPAKQPRSLQWKSMYSDEVANWSFCSHTFPLRQSHTGSLIDVVQTWCAASA